MIIFIGVRQGFNKLMMFVACRTSAEGEHFGVNDADPAAVVENVYQARSEVREVSNPQDQIPEVEEETLLASLAKGSRHGRQV